MHTAVDAEVFAIAASDPHLWDATMFAPLPNSRIKLFLERNVPELQAPLKPIAQRSHPL